jgi:hypothetical protein
VKNEIIRPAAQVGAHRHARAVEQILGTASKKLDRLPLQLALPAAVLGEDRLRRRPERAVIEKNDVGVEQELRAQVFGGRCGREQGHKFLPRVGDWVIG